MRMNQLSRVPWFYSTFSLVSILFLFLIMPGFAPVFGAVITVTGSGDTIATDGLTTLREAIDSVNNQADTNGDVTSNRVGNYASLSGGTPDTINFNIAGSGVKIISVNGNAEPTITRQVTIDGYTQTGASANTQTASDDAVILIRLDGAGASAGVDGLTLGAGSGASTIRGLSITNFPGDGLVIESNSNAILGNFIGVDPSGVTRAPNGSFPNSGDGIQIVSASNNHIGSPNIADRNIISGNAIDGIHIIGTLTLPATGNLIQGNYIGVANDGISSVGNRTEPAPHPGAAEGNNLFGIEISGGNLNTIGGVAANAGNVIGYNGDGIDLDNGAQQNVVQGNLIGVGADGATAVKNLLHGVAMRSSNGFAAPLGPAQSNEPGTSFNSIGGTIAGAANIIQNNGGAGVAVFGNPVSASGDPNIGNAIEGNSIFKNGRDYQTASSAPTPLLGIDLSADFTYPRDDGSTPNDSHGHGGSNDPNNFQNFPVLISASSQGGTTLIAGTLQSTANTTYRIEFFANDLDPLTLPAEGQEFLGSTTVTTDSSGSASFNTSLSISVATGRLATATATDLLGNTSEFSAAKSISSCDTDPPVISVPQTITAKAQTKKVHNRQGAFVSFGVSAVDPEDGSVAVTANPRSGSFFHIGTTTVHVTATDHCGNTSTASFNVRVVKKKKKH